jgi:hypothetical protein
MSQRSKELASALVRTQARLRGCERALERFVAGAGKADQPRLAAQHTKLLTAIDTAKNDIIVIERSMRAEAERPFDWLAFKMGA